MSPNKIDAARNLLSDDLSKTVFERRLLYAETGNNVHLFNMLTDAFSAQSWFRYESNNNLVNIAKTLIEKKESGNNVKIILFGAGNGALTPLQLIHEYGFTKMDSVSCLFCDNNPALWGKKRDHRNPNMRLPILSPEEIKTFASDVNCWVIITINSQHASQAVFEQCLSLGFDKNRIIKQTDQYEYFLGRMYFEEGIVPHSEKEIFCDVGAYDMANSQQFIQWSKGNYEKIIAFEADPVSYEKCKETIEIAKLERVELLFNGLHSSNTEMRFLSAPDGEYGGSRIDDSGEVIVKAITLDSYLKGAPVSFIKMDIEGAELDALKGAENTIKTWKPKLAISAYHKLWDIVELPLFIKELNPQYKFYLRHHTCGIYDTVLYAV